MVARLKADSVLMHGLGLGLRYSIAIRIPEILRGEVGPEKGFCFVLPLIPLGEGTMLREKYCLLNIPDLPSMLVAQGFPRPNYCIATQLGNGFMGRSLFKN